MALQSIGKSWFCGKKDALFMFSVSALVALYKTRLMDALRISSLLIERELLIDVPGNYSLL